MRARVFLQISLGFNLVLAVTLLVLSQQYRNSPAPAAAPPPVAVTNGPPRTHVVVRRESFSWQDVESEDYRVYIANLRQIACPEPTIRDIIIAEINNLFDRRRATEIVTGEQQWWRSVPDPDVIATAAAKLQQLSKERRDLLADLLGPKWEGTNQFNSNLSPPLLDGPILGALPAETKTALRELEARSNQLSSLLWQERTGAGDVDPTTGVRLRLQLRKDLAAILNPTQMEEYLLRYSGTAEAMRNELKGLNVTADEFRAIFRIRDNIEQEYLSAVDGGDALRIPSRESLAKRAEDAAKLALGQDRYQLFRYTRDPSFREVQTRAEQLGAPADVVIPVYQITQATEAERRRLREDDSLTPEQRQAAIETVLVQQKDTLKKLLGDKIYEQYQTEKQN